MKALQRKAIPQCTTTLQGSAQALIKCSAFALVYPRYTHSKHPLNMTTDLWFWTTARAVSSQGSAWGSGPWSRRCAPRAGTRPACPASIPRRVQQQQHRRRGGSGGRGAAVAARVVAPCRRLSSRRSVCPASPRLGNPRRQSYVNKSRVIASDAAGITWLPYTKFGQQIPGTRFIAFKCPLKHVNGCECGGRGDNEINLPAAGEVTPMHHARIAVGRCGNQIEPINDLDLQMLPQSINKGFYITLGWVLLPRVLNTSAAASANCGAQPQILIRREMLINLLHTRQIDSAHTFLFSLLCRVLASVDDAKQAL
ncbi:hypothetical protein B566_EDAN004223 [Ephemera danica]|nr:hypothetical protein B566_EDAN004223 [Ephemera danica]